MEEMMKINISIEDQIILTLAVSKELTLLELKKLISQQIKLKKPLTAVRLKYKGFFYLYWKVSY